MTSKPFGTLTCRSLDGICIQLEQNCSCYVEARISFSWGTFSPDSFLFHYWGSQCNLDVSALVLVVVSACAFVFFCPALYLNCLIAFVAMSASIHVSPSIRCYVSFRLEFVSPFACRHQVSLEICLPFVPTNQDFGSHPFVSPILPLLLTVVTCLVGLVGGFWGMRLLSELLYSHLSRLFIHAAPRQGRTEPGSKDLPHFLLPTAMWCWVYQHHMIGPYVLQHIWISITYLPYIFLFQKQKSEHNTTPPFIYMVSWPSCKK